MKTICIYHGNCFDGFTAAWVIRRALGEGVLFYPGVYTEPAPDVTGMKVIMVDFSYPAEVILKMLDQCETMLLLDHHKTCAEEVLSVEAVRRHPKLAFDIDMNRSGAGIAWDYFFSRDTRPLMINYVEDRDLWRFNHQGTRAFQAGMSSFPFTFEAWDKIWGTSPETIIQMGQAIDRKHLQDVARLLPIVRREMVIGGMRVPVANLPMTMTSDAGNMMAEQASDRFAACYWDTPKGRVFSLRSAATGVDVAAIAQKYGGGGHQHAAGFTAPQNWEGDYPA